MSHPEPPAIRVAEYLVALAAAEDEPDYLTHMRLQKLLYYVEGWSLALRDKSMFTEPIEAWSHGPVVPVVYRKLKSYGDQVIPLDAFEKVTGSLTEEDKEFIQRVWDTYSDYSATSLRRMTHQEAPWQEAREHLRPEAASQRPISRDTMREYFKKLADQ